MLSLFHFAVEKGLDISFIEEMPLGEMGSHNRDQTAFTSDAIKQQLNNEFELNELIHVDPASGPGHCDIFN